MMFLLFLQFEKFTLQKLFKTIGKMEKVILKWYYFHYKLDWPICFWHYLRNPISFLQYFFLLLLPFPRLFVANLTSLSFLVVLSPRFSFVALWRMHKQLQELMSGACTELIALPRFCLTEQVLACCKSSQ